MACDYCAAVDLPKTTMQRDIGRKAIDLFVSLALGARSIDFVYSGGEPLCETNLLVDLTRYARRQTLSAGMSSSFVVKSNGTVLSKRIIDFLKLSEARLVVSVDGALEAHDKHRVTKTNCGTHAEATRTILAAIRNEINCSASLTVHPDVAEHVPENVRYLYDLGVRQIDIGPVYGTVSWSPEQIAALSQALNDVADFMQVVRRGGGQIEVGPLYQGSEHVGGKLAGCWGCKAAAATLAFLPDGQIAGCSALAMLSKKFPELIVGDVFGGIDQEAVSRVVQLAQATGEDRPSCRSCGAADNCSGGCLAFNYATRSSPLAPPDVYCATISQIPIAWERAWR
jgi:uncharacterized protein